MVKTQFPKKMNEQAVSDVVKNPENTTKDNNEVAQPILVSIDVIAMRYGLSKSFLYHQVAERKIPYYKIGAALRFDLAEIDAYIAAFRVAPYARGGLR